MTMKRTDGSTPSHYDIYQNSRTLLVATPDRQLLGFACGEKSRPFSSSFRKPYLKLRRGADETGLILAHLEFYTAPHTSKWKYCLGDPCGANPTAWKDIDVGGYKNGRVSWHMQTERDGTRRQHPLVWKRTSHVFVGDVRPSLCRRLGGTSYKLVNTQTKQVHAAFTTGFPEIGRLEIYDDYGGDFKTIALITLLGVIDDNRRRMQRTHAAGGAAAAAGAGAAGGGGC